MLKIQEGMTLFEIGQEKGFPTFRTLANWRRTKPEFFHLLNALDEDHRRDARRSIRGIVGQLHQQLIDRPELLVLNSSAVNTVVSGYEKIAKIPTMSGDAPVADKSEDMEEQRRNFDLLHPVTQERIRQALIEDRRLREAGEGESDD